MIVNTGKAALLGSQATYLASLELGLYTSPVTITPATKFADLSEASWVGYVRVTLGAISPVVIVNNRARCLPVATPVFVNSSGGTVTWAGWFVIDPATSLLIAATAVQVQSIPDMSNYPLRIVVTDQDVSQ